jgi:hypothetical protein
LLTIPCSTVIANQVNNQIDKTKTITVWIPGLDNEDLLIQSELTQEDFDKINLSLNACLEVMTKTVNENSIDGINISESEWDEIKVSIYEIIYNLKEILGVNFPWLEILTFIDILIKALRGPFFLIRQPLLSIGIGFTLIPFYDYETFIGKMLRPVFMRHFIGFSITARLNPFILGFPYWHFGYQRVRTFFFNGLHINCGDLGHDRIIGPQLLLGYGVFTGLNSVNIKNLTKQLI